MQPTDKCAKFCIGHRAVKSLRFVNIFAAVASAALTIKHDASHGYVTLLIVSIPVCRFICMCAFM